MLRRTQRSGHGAANEFVLLASSLTHTNSWPELGNYLSICWRCVGLSFAWSLSCHGPQAFLCRLMWWIARVASVQLHQSHHDLLRGRKSRHVLEKLREARHSVLRS